LKSDLWNGFEENWVAEHKVLRVTREQFSRDPQSYMFITASRKDALQYFLGTSQYYLTVISSG